MTYAALSWTWKCLFVVKISGQSCNYTDDHVRSKMLPKTWQLRAPGNYMIPARTEWNAPLDLTAPGTWELYDTSTYGVKCSPRPDSSGHLGIIWYQLGGIASLRSAPVSATRLGSRPCPPPSTPPCTSLHTHTTLTSAEPITITL